MQNSNRLQRRISLTPGLVAFGLAGALLFLPGFFGSLADSRTNGFSQTTQSHRDGLENYDIRTDKEAVDKLAGFRHAANKNAADVADVRDEFVRGEAELRRRVPTLNVEYNSDIRTPEIIGAGPSRGRSALTGPSNSKRSDVLRTFAKENASLIGITHSQSDSLKETADYTNPDGNLSFVHLEQHINGIPVFRGEIKAAFTKHGEMFRVINNLASGLEYATLSQDFGDPTGAVRAAAVNIDLDADKLNLTANAAASSDIKVTYGDGDWPTTAEKMYFPTEPGVAVPAWRVLIWEKVNAYYVIVDASSGTVLWRKNITDDQTQSATYNVYAATDNLGKAMDSPAPASPHPGFPGNPDPATVPTFQAALGSRSAVTLIGNEGNLSFNNLGWITDNTNGADGWTDGNAVQAGLDIDGTNGVDAPQNGTGRVFDFAYNPSNVLGGTGGGGTEGGDPPTSAAYRSGVVTNLFYLCNRYHDALYQVGFTEAARNFQNDYFGRGGLAADRVSAEAQDSSGTNNANFSTPADGGRGRMQMYLFTNGTAPQRDGSLDANVVWHEHTHGVSNRLIGNGSGLASTESGGLGEGWSDFYAFLLGSKTGDPINGVYPTGGYVTYKCCGATTYTGNYYYGIRRFPYAIKSFTGGP